MRMASSAHIRAISVVYLFRSSSVLFSKVPHCSHCSSQAAQDKVKPPGLLKRYLIDKVIDMVNESTIKLEKAYPAVFQIYRTFKTGLSSFVRDSREYYQVITGLWSGQSLTELSRHQLEILRQVPRDFFKVIPVLVLALVPGGTAAIPLAYVFPQSFLSYHFWTEQQRQKFWKSDLKHRLQHLKPILDYMQVLTRHIEDCHQENNILQIIKKVQLSVHPSIAEVLEVKPLFESYPYNLSRISIAYMRHLAKCTDMPLRRSRLRAGALLLHYSDLAMLREGINNLTDFELEQACYWRGLNPFGLKREEQVIYLQHWTTISKALDENSISLLLHLPVMLGFCQPTNRELIGGRQHWWRHQPFTH